MDERSGRDPPDPDKRTAATGMAAGAGDQRYWDNEDDSLYPELQQERDAGTDLLRAAFEELSAATDGYGKLKALGRAARDLATPVRRGLIDYYDAEQGLIDLAESHGLIDALTRGAVEAVIVNSLKTPGQDEPPPPDGPDDYGRGAALVEQSLTLPPLPPLTIIEWRERELPEPDFLLGYWMTTTCRVLFVADTGLGKSIFMIGAGMAIAAGAPFLHWRAGRPCRVLYIDGEMSRRLLRQRIADEATRIGCDPAGFFALSHEDIDGFTPLNTPAGQACIEKIIENIGGVDLIIFDAIMCLIAGDMKEEEPWQQTLPWIRSLTRRGIGQIWVHHTGHDATRSYGTKTREWQMDTVLHGDAAPRDDTDISFSLEFKKARERTPATRADFQTTKIALVGDAWSSEAERTARKGHVSPLALKFFDALQNVLAGGSSLRNGQRCAALDGWKAECLRLGLLDSDKPHSARTLLGKQRRDLVAANYVACEGEWTWTL